MKMKVRDPSTALVVSRLAFFTDPAAATVAVERHSTSCQTTSYRSACIVTKSLSKFAEARW